MTSLEMHKRPLGVQGVGGERVTSCKFGWLFDIIEGCSFSAADLRLSRAVGGQAESSSRSPEPKMADVC